jgi:choline-sulfatase
MGAVRGFLPAALAAAACVAVGCARASPPPAARPSSVLLVTIDTLRADRLGCYGDREARTPALDALAREGVLFEAAFTHVPITLPAHATLFTGLLPPAHGVRGNGAFALPPGPPTLAEALKARGLRTGAFVGGFPLARRFGLARGFDHYDDAMSRAPGVHYEFAERPAAAVVQSALAWLAGQAGDVFLWVHVFDPHAPYDPPPAHRGPDPYRGEIAAVDESLRNLLQAWDRRPGGSVVAVTADHGEAFGEHGEESHSLFVYDTTLRVPLILKAPGLPAGGRVTAAAGLVDVPATILDLVGAPAALPGASLRPLAESPGAAGRAVYAETLAPRLDFGWSDLRSWREGGFKYIRAPRPELYELSSDPAESRDLSSARPEVMARMEAALARAVAEDTESRRQPDPESAERLRALGYVQGPEGRGSGADPKDRTEVARRIARAAGFFTDHLAAVRAYREIADLDPENPLVNFRLADALLRAGQAREAVRHFQKVVASGPRSADPYVGLATAQAEQGRLEEARRTLERALVVEPGHGQAHYNLGEIARARGDLAAARAAYEAARADPAVRGRADARLQSLGPAR